MITDLKNKKLHFVGIGGSGMSGLANIFLDLGFQISGSDLKSSSITDFLSQRGAQIFIGHKTSNILEDTAVVIYSNAVPEENPEIQKAYALNIPIIPRAELVRELLKLKKPIGITGTHGKTTTTSLIGAILEKADLHPSLMLGGTTKFPNKNAYLGKGDYIVYEACEAFASIDYMFAEIAVITNIDNDHMDYYKNMDNLLSAFLNYINRTPFYGIAILNGDDTYIRQLLPSINKKYLLCGLVPNNGVYAENIVMEGFNSSFDIYYQNKKIDRFNIPIPGKHNIYNSLLAIAVALYLEIPTSTIKEALQKFQSPYRRFQFHGRYKGAYIIDDYAHHPTEVSTTIDTAQQIKSQNKSIRRVIIIFQPHLYSRTKEHMKAFALALAKADFLIIDNIYGARETNNENISSEMLGDELSKLGFKHYYVSKNMEDTLFYVKNIASENDIILTMGAGNIHLIASQLIELDKES